MTGNQSDNTLPEHTAWLWPVKKRNIEFHCGRHGEVEDFSEKYWMISYVERLGIGDQETSDVSI